MCLEYCIGIRSNRLSLIPVASGDDDHIAFDLFNIHENDREIKPDVYVSKTPCVEGFPKSFKKIGGTIPGPKRLLLTNIYYLFCKTKHWYSIN